MTLLEGLSNDDKAAILDQLCELQEFTQDHIPKEFVINNNFHPSGIMVTLDFVLEDEHLGTHSKIFSYVEIATSNINILICGIQDMAKEVKRIAEIGGYVFD